MTKNNKQHIEGSFNLEWRVLHTGIWMVLFFLWTVSSGVYPMFKLPEDLSFIDIGSLNVTRYVFVLFFFCSILFIWSSISYMQKKRKNLIAWMFPLVQALLLIIAVLALI